METKHIEVDLSVSQVIKALQKIQHEFAEKQEMLSLSMPYVQCSELQARHVLDNLPAIGISGPTNDTLFEFFADWKKTFALQRVWTVRIYRSPEATSIDATLMDNQQAEIHELFWIFINLLETWALGQKNNRLPAILTPKQKEVADCLADGLDDQGIAERLIMDCKTAKKHRQNIAKKWNVGEAIGLLQVEARRRGHGKST